MRIALGSATAAILTASALVGRMASSLPGLETLLVLSCACGVTVDGCGQTVVCGLCKYSTETAGPGSGGLPVVAG